MRSEEEQILEKELSTSRDQKVESKDLEREEEDFSDSKVLKERWKIFRKLYNCFFLIESPAFEPIGLCPSFEREVLYDNYQKNSFTRPSLFWERVYRDTRPLYHSVSVKKREK